MEPPLHPHRWRDRVRALYRELEAELEPHRDLCRMRGICCDFRSAEHQLFATEAEVRYLLDSRPVPEPTEEALCPFWQDGLCHAREARPLGCRTYFCDPSWREKGEALHARFHRKLVDIHREEGLPYEYRGWVDRLREERERERAP